MRAQRQRFERHQGKHHQEGPATPTPPQRHSFGKLFLVLALVSLWLYGLGHFRRAYRVTGQPLT
jgi:hypothetical protein